MISMLVSSASSPVLHLLATSKSFAKTKNTEPKSEEFQAFHKDIPIRKQV
jgi:hypothetical protein